MQLFNSESRFGLLVRWCHRIIALLFIVQFYLVYRRDYFPKDAPEKLQYILLHKSLGAVALGLATLFLILHFVGKRPSLPAHMPLAERLAARVTHLCLYGILFLMPASGYLMSCYAGYPPKLFGLALPVLVAQDKASAGFWHDIHVYASYAVIALVLVHTVAALKHHFIDKDEILARMM